VFSSYLEFRTKDEFRKPSDSQCIYVCKGWAKIHPALALRPPRSIMVPLLVYPSLNCTLLMKCRNPSRAILSVTITVLYILLVQSVWSRHEHFLYEIKTP
jgi:hypothetical protein